MSDPLASIRSKLKGEKSSSAPVTVPNDSQTKLLIAIAHTNGHAQPKVWAQQVTDYLAGL